MNCDVCKTRKAWTTCKGCDKPVCESCSRLEVISAGVDDGVLAEYYCINCVKNPSINPNALLREPE